MSKRDGTFRTFRTFRKRNAIVADLEHMPKRGDADFDENENAALAGAPIDTCSICGGVTALPYETPDDPPMYRGGRHCASCEDWLLGVELDTEERNEYGHDNNDSGDES